MHANGTAQTVEWDEFINTVNALERGSPYDKLAFCFQVYDQVSRATALPPAADLRGRV